MTTARGDRDPLLHPDPQRERLDQALFDGIADSYARKDVIESTRTARAAIIRRAVRPVLEEFGTLGTVVDVGCGVGAQALHLKGTYERYLGIDYSSRLIEIGSTLLAGERNCELIAANIKSTDLPSNAADTILVVGALHHMTDIPEVMVALKRIARSGARLVAIEPQRENPAIQAMRWIRSRIDSGYSSEQHFFSKSEMVKILQEAGVASPRVEFQGYLTPPFAQVVLNPQWLFSPVARAACRFELVLEKLVPGPLSWNLVAYGRFEK